MKKNMSKVDQAIRLTLLLGIAVLYFTNLISGTLAIVLLVVGGIFLLTGLVGFCPAYALFGIRTCPADK